MKIRAYSDYYGDDVPGKGNIAYDKAHQDVVIHGFRHHKMQEDLIKQSIEDNKLLIKELQLENRELRKRLK